MVTAARLTLGIEQFIHLKSHFQEKHPVLPIETFLSRILPKNASGRVGEVKNKENFKLLAPKTCGHGCLLKVPK